MGEREKSQRDNHGTSQRESPFFSVVLPRQVQCDPEAYPGTVNWYRTTLGDGTTETTPSDSPK